MFEFYFCRNFQGIKVFFLKIKSEDLKVFHKRLKGKSNSNFNLTPSFKIKALCELFND